MNDQFFMEFFFWIISLSFLLSLCKISQQSLDHILPFFFCAEGVVWNLKLSICDVQLIILSQQDLEILKGLTMTTRETWGNMHTNFWEFSSTSVIVEEILPWYTTENYNIWITSYANHHTINRKKLQLLKKSTISQLDKKNSA